TDLTPPGSSSPDRELAGKTGSASTPALPGNSRLAVQLLWRAPLLRRRGSTPQGLAGVAPLRAASAAQKRGPPQDSRRPQKALTAKARIGEQSPLRRTVRPSVVPHLEAIRLDTR